MRFSFCFPFVNWSFLASPTKSYQGKNKAIRYNSALYFDYILAQRELYRYVSDAANVYAGLLPITPSARVWYEINRLEWLYVFNNKSLDGQKTTYNVLKEHRFFVFRNLVFELK